MINKLGKEIKLYKAKTIDFSLKYDWIRGARKMREKYYSKYLCPFTDIPPRPGIYLFCFPDGFYVGQAKNLEQRFSEHFFAFYSKRTKDWHNSFGLDSYGAAQHFLKYECDYYYIEVEEEELDLYEQSALAQIVLNEMTEKYYNTIFYKQADEYKVFYKSEEFFK